MYENNIKIYLDLNNHYDYKIVNEEKQTEWLADST